MLGLTTDQKVWGSTPYSCTIFLSNWNRIGWIVKGLPDNGGLLALRLTVWPKYGRY